MEYKGKRNVIILNFIILIFKEIINQEIERKIQLYLHTVHKRKRDKVQEM